MTEEREEASQIRAILFACNMNSVRSPMAEALARKLLRDRVRVDSCGVYEGILDPFAAEVLREADIPVPSRDPQDFSKVKTESYDLVIALTPEAAAEARRHDVRVEFWDTENPTNVRGSREAVLEAYRAVRDELDARIRARFC